MNCRSKKSCCATKTKPKGFSLVELVAAVVILGLICTGALVIINNSMEKGSDLMWRAKAFDVARENMEALLAKDSLTSETDQGFDEIYPDILWETKVDTTMQEDIMWVEAVSTASYIDSAGEEQTVELSHWLTSLSKETMKQIMKQQQLEAEWLAEQRDFGDYGDYDGEGEDYVYYDPETGELKRGSQDRQPRDSSETGRGSGSGGSRARPEDRQEDWYDEDIEPEDEPKQPEDDWPYPKCPQELSIGELIKCLQQNYGFFK